MKRGLGLLLRVLARLEERSWKTMVRPRPRPRPRPRGVARMTGPDGFAVMNERLRALREAEAEADDGGFLR